MTEIAVDDLWKSYSRQNVVRGVSFRARPARITGLFGPNGSGKSTTMRVMTGLSSADRGSALFDER
jgi:ABC-2 type transport system ATP-binding protein